METVFEAWRAQLDDADAFREPGTTVRVRTEGHDDSVSVVVLFDRVLVSVFCAPPQSVRAALENHQPPETLAEETTMARLVGPIERTLGPAVLGYLDGERVTPQDPGGLITVDGDDPGLLALAERCGPEEAAESDIGAWSSPVRVLAQGGLIVAAAGFQVWADSLAHLGVLTDRPYRREGHGRRVAGAAVADAVEQGLIPQWRTRTDLTASRRLAAVLGFEERGRQAVFWPRPPPD